MKPLQGPYNLRSRDHVVDYSDTSTRKSGSKRGKVSTRKIILEDTHGKKERINQRPTISECPTGKNAIEHPRSKEKRELKCSHYSDKLEDVFPYPLVAMQHYNKNRKEEEQYKVSECCEDMCFYVRKIGFIRLLHFKAQRILGNSRTVHFYALVHQKPNRDTHVSYCEPHPDPPKSGGPSVAKIVPLRCDVCGLNGAEEIKARSKELRERSDTRKLEGGEESDSDYYDGYSELDSTSDRALWAPGRTFAGKRFKE